MVKRDGILEGYNDQSPHTSFQAWGGGYSRPTQTQSDKICPNFHWGVRGLLQTNSNPKCQDLPNFSFFGREGGVVQTNIPEILEWGH